MATAETSFGGGLNSSLGGELKLYLSCTGSTQHVLIFAKKTKLKAAADNKSFRFAFSRTLTYHQMCMTQRSIIH